MNYRSLSVTDTNATGSWRKMEIRDRVSIGEVRGNGEYATQTGRRSLRENGRSLGREFVLIFWRSFAKESFTSLSIERKKERARAGVSIVIERSILIPRSIVPVCRYLLSWTKHDSSVREMTCNPFVSFSLSLSFSFSPRITAAWRQWIKNL